MLKEILFVVLAVFFTQNTLAQQFYKWKEDEKGQLYSDFLPTGVTAETLRTDNTPQTPEAKPSVSSDGEHKKAEHSSDRSTQSASDDDLVGSDSRRLLVFPPFDTGKPLSEWIPVESFDSVEECNRARSLQIAHSVVQSTDFSGDVRTSVDFETLNSRCISLAEYKPSKEANVIVAVTSVGPDPGGFSTWLLYGKVFNGGRTTARNVVVRYRVRDTRGIIYAAGEILPTPKDIPSLLFADYRGQIVGSLGGSDRWVETEARWSKD
jgi:hypothetical protein